MLLRQIKYFHSVVEEGSFTKAAELHFISQSAISQQIHSLENELDVALLIRRNRGFDVTDAGHYFYKKTIKIIHDLEEVCNETQIIASDQAAHLFIGCLQSYDGNEIQIAMARFAEKFPDVELSVKTGSHEDLYQGLVNGEYDIVFNDQRRVFAEGYHNLVLTESATYVEIATFNPLSQANHLTIEDLRYTPFILVTSKDQNDVEEAYYRDIIGLEGEFIFVSTLQEARILVAANRGAMLVDGDVNEQYIISTLKRLPLYRDNKPVIQRYCAFWKRGNSGYYVESLTELLLDVFNK